jgi:mannan endo-1,4-beta-mannosidase
LRTGIATLLLGGFAHQAPASTFTVDSATLLDPCGEALVLRGVNAGIAFPNDPTAKQLPEIAKTGANAVRLTFRWLYDKSDPAEVETALQVMSANNMVALPSVWDASGNWSKLPFAVDFWAQPEMVSVLRKYEDRVLLNIANEAGDISVTSTQFRDGYASAVQQLRAAGLHMPLVIDAAYWGRRESDLLDNGQYLLEQDPDHNLLFSWHPWDPNQPVERYRQAIDSAKSRGISMIIGEFSNTGAEGEGAVDYAALIQLAAEREVGWLWWWWWSGSITGLHQMTTDGNFGNWTNVGEEVALTNAYSIAATSQRTHFLQTGACAVAPNPPPAPNPPSGLQAVATEGSEITLSWEDNSDDEKNFDIEVWNNNTQRWQLIKATGPNTRSASIGGDLAFVYAIEPEQDPSLDYATRYRFRVGAYRSRDAVSYSRSIVVSSGRNPRVCSDGHGLKGEYYAAEHQSLNFDDYGEPNMVRIDPRINFDWNAGSPNPTRIASDQFQIRWTGFVMPQFDGVYDFFTDSDDFARVWVNDQLLIDNWRANAYGWDMGSIVLEAGKKYPIRVEYREWTGDARMELHWAHSRVAREIIPQCRLFDQ